MKQIKLLTFFVLCALGATAQTNNDTTKYFKSKDYGWIWKRGKFRQLVMPNDTTVNKLGVALKGNTLYSGDGSTWSPVTSYPWNDQGDNFTLGMLALGTGTPFGDAALSILATNNDPLTGIEIHPQNEAALTQIGHGGIFSTAGFNVSASGPVGYGTLDNNDVSLSTNNTLRMTITGIGSVGIGTNGPQAQLHTTGTVRFAGIGRQSKAADSMMVVNAVNGEVGYRAIPSGGGGTNFWTQTGANISNNTGTNVGVGITAPISKLHVNGSARIGDTLSFNDGGYGPTYQSRVYKLDAPTLRMEGIYLSLQSSHPGGNILLQTAGGIAYMNSAAQFSLGSFVPTSGAKLHVEGNTQTTGTLGVGSASAPVASAVVDIVSTTKGVLLPRLTTTQVNAIAAPATGLTVFNTTLGELCYFNGSAWRKVTSSAM
jgi:hypothetical protein